MTATNLFDEHLAKAEQTISSFADKISTFRTDRAHPGILKNVKVACYDQHLPLWEVASVNVFDATSIVVQPFDPAILPAISKAVLSANLNLNPVPVGDKSLKITVPPLTTASRDAIVKKLWSTAEEYQVHLRNTRRHLTSQIKHLNLGQDETQNWLKKIDDRFKQLIAEIRSLTVVKADQLSRMG